MKRLKGFKDLVVDTVEHTTNLVQDTHDSVSRKVFWLIKLAPPLRTPATVVETVTGVATTVVYASIRGTNRVVGRVLDHGLEAADEDDVPEEEPVPLRSDAAGTDSWLRDAALGALNGVVGDYLAHRGNGLAIEMSLRHGDDLLPLDRIGLMCAVPEPSRKLCVLVHGLAATEWSWSIYAQDKHGHADANYGSLLQQDLGFTPIYLRYNSGRHISQNGQQLAEMLEQLVDSWPEPVEEVVLIGHSMGGLVARSAAHYGDEAKMAWTERLAHVFCLGTPHQGTPLEKIGNAVSYVLGKIDLPATQITSRLINVRSAGIKDLRYGYVTHDDWVGADADALLENRRKEVPFVAHASYYFAAATLTNNPDHPVSALVGDMLVRLPSARGDHHDESRRIPFDPSGGVVLGGTSHLQLANHPAVYAQIKRFVSR